MKHLKLVLIVMVMLLGLAVSAQAGLVYQPVDFSAHFNGHNQGRNSNYPYGNPVIFGGVPFNIPGGPLNTWDSNSGYGFRSVDIAVNLYGVQEIHTLINTSWGATGGPYAWVEFWGSGGAYYRKDLYGNYDIRDWYHGWYTNYINNTTTINVYDNGWSCIDKQQIVLPLDFYDEVLTTMRLSDNGAPYFQRVFLYGVTAAVVPLPPGVLLLGSGLLGLLGWRRLHK